MVRHSLVHLIEVGNYAISAEVYPKGHSISIGEGEGVKVLHGSIGFFDTDSPYSSNPAAKPLELGNETISNDVFRFGFFTIKPTSDLSNASAMQILVAVSSSIAVPLEIGRPNRLLAVTW